MHTLVYCLYLNSTVGHVGDALVRPDHQLDGDRPAGAERAAIPLLVEPVHGLEDLEELEHALEVAEHRKPGGGGHSWARAGAPAGQGL